MKEGKVKNNELYTYVNKWYVLIPLLFLVLVFVAPLLKLLYVSLWSTAGGESVFTLDYYEKFLKDGYYLKVLWTSLWLSFLSVIFCVLMGYPIAYAIAHTKGFKRSLAIVCVVLPLWVSITIRMYGWMSLLNKDGIISSLFASLHLIAENTSLMGTNIGVLIGLIHCGLPYMIMILISPIENVNRDLEDASYVFGAGFFKTFLKVTFPLTLPGLISASLLVFSLNTAAFVVPVMLGAGKITVMTTLIYQQALYVYDWPFAAAISGILLIATLIIVGISNSYTNEYEAQEIQPID